MPQATFFILQIIAVSIHRAFLYFSRRAPKKSSPNLTLKFTLLQTRTDFPKTKPILIQNSMELIKTNMEFVFSISTPILRDTQP